MARVRRVILPLLQKITGPESTATERVEAALRLDHEDQTLSAVAILMLAGSTLEHIADADTKALSEIEEMTATKKEDENG